MVVVVVCPQLKPVQQLFKQLHVLQQALLKVFEELQLHELQQLQELIEEVEQQVEQLQVLAMQLEQLQLVQQLQQLLVGSLHQEVVFEHL